uniref:Uncharacterized protein n=1 Tax=Timema douglasi TaxID=61478 RepID=A0A7R8ZDZ0_TIMDO|nr:unnamed protein product [Timema douglasi]
MFSWALDKDNSGSMNELIENLKKVPVYTNLNTNIAALVASILQLRQKKWGDTTNFSPEATALSWAPQKDEPVFYGPDGQIITPEESKFLQESTEATSEVEDNDEYG